jgi:hypothetical protein
LLVALDRFFHLSQFAVGFPQGTQTVTLNFTVAGLAGDGQCLLALHDRFFCLSRWNPLARETRDEIPKLLAKNEAEYTQPNEYEYPYAKGRV